MKRVLGVGCWVLGFGILFHSAASAQHPTPNTQHPSVILILAEGLTLDDLENPQNPTLRDFAKNGKVALMSAPVAGPKNDTAAMLALAAGMLAPAEDTDGEAFGTSEPHPEGGTGGEVYYRRTGALFAYRAALDPLYPYAGIAAHLGIAPLIRRRLNTKLLASDLPEGTVAVAGNADTDRPARPVALFGMNSSGRIDSAYIGRDCLNFQSNTPYSKSDSPRQLAAWTLTRAGATLVVVHLGDLARADSARPRLGEARYQQARRRAVSGLDTLLKSLLSRAAARKINPRILIVSPRPPLDPAGGWSRLALLVLGWPGANEKPGLLTSATTRTNGLVSNLDVAPTLLSWLNVRPPAHMTGHPITFSTGDPSYLRRMDLLTQANARGIVPIFVGLGIIAAVAVFGGLLAIRLGRGARPASFMMLILSNFPLAMLLVVLLHPRSVAELGGFTGIIMLALGLIEYLSGAIVHRFHPSQSLLRAAILTLAALTVGTILIDALLGQYLIKFSLFSSYQVPGIRFYGIGNEYMGVLVGMCLLLVFMGKFRPSPAAALFGVTALILGIPFFGADAGGLVAAVVAFGAALLVLTGRRADWKAAAVLAASGFAFALALAFAENAIAGGGSSHLGGAIQSTKEQGWGTLLDIIERKARMNLGILLNGFTLTAIAGATAVVLLVRGPLRTRLTQLVDIYPDWNRGLSAAGWGALAAFLFNDSGAVPAIFILGAFISSGLIILFTLPYNPISES